MGLEAHRKLAASEAGADFFRKGKPAQKAMDEALKGQVATTLNMLNFVLDVMQLFDLGRLKQAFTFRELKEVEIREALQDKHELLQDKYAALVGYVKSAKKFGLVTFPGRNFDPFHADDMVITLKAVGCSRPPSLLMTRWSLLEMVTVDDKMLALIAESNSAGLSARLCKLGWLPHRRVQLSKDEDEVQRKIREMIHGFLSGDDQSVKDALKEM
jgi:hypothetical protein